MNGNTAFFAFCLCVSISCSMTGRDDARRINALVAAMDDSLILNLNGKTVWKNTEEPQVAVNDLLASFKKLGTV